MPGSFFHFIGFCFRYCSQQPTISRRADPGGFFVHLGKIIIIRIAHAGRDGFDPVVGGAQKLLSLLYADLRQVLGKALARLFFDQAADVAFIQAKFPGKHL